MSEKIKYDTIVKVERKIEDMEKEELYISLKDYCEEIGLLKNVEDNEDSIQNFICKNFSIETEENEILEDSLKSAMIEILYNNSYKDNLLFFDALNFIDDYETDNFDEEEYEDDIDLDDDEDEI